MAIQDITKDTINQFVTDHNVALLDFWAPWCAPCRMMAPIVEEIADGESTLAVGKVNIDQEAELANQFRVMSIPTFIIFENGVEIKRSIGMISKADLEAVIREKMG